jgi:hypothetical protein
MWVEVSDYTAVGLAHLKLDPQLKGSTGKGWNDFPNLKVGTHEKNCGPKGIRANPGQYWVETMGAAELRRLFAKYDPTRVGIITVSDLGKMLRSPHCFGPGTNVPIPYWT